MITKVTHLRTLTEHKPTGRLEVTFDSGRTTTCKDDGSFNEHLQRSGEPVLVQLAETTPVKMGFEDAFRRKPSDAIMSEGAAKAKVVGH